MASVTERLEGLWRSFREAAPRFFEVGGRRVAIAVRHARDGTRPAGGDTEAMCVFMPVAVFNEAPEGAESDVRVIDLKGKEHPYVRGDEVLHSATLHVVCAAGPTLLDGLAERVRERLQRWVEALETQGLAFGITATEYPEARGVPEVQTVLHLYFFARAQT